MLDMMGGMGLMMLFGLLVVAAVIGVAIYLAIRGGVRRWSGRVRAPRGVAAAAGSRRDNG